MQFSAYCRRKASRGKEASIEKPWATELAHPPGYRSGSGFCAHCAYATMHKLTELAKVFSDVQEPVFLTIVPSNPSLKPAELSSLDVELHRDALKSAWHDAGLSSLPFIGAIDLGWNTYEGITSASFWCAHWHGLAPLQFKTEIEQRLRGACPNTVHFHTTIQGKLITKTPERVHNYCSKQRSNHGIS